MDTISGLKKYVRATNYIAAAQIYLQDNVLLKDTLLPEHIKPRLLGHWGTCPGINFTYAHLNALIKEKGCDMLFVLGPGHGFPALQANLFLEGSLHAVDQKATQDEDGLRYIASHFSWPYGFPSHSNPEAPGVVLEGGELGYALATAYGATLDNPELIVPVLIGDGEAETGPTATAWHTHRLIDPATNGAVLPILHLNGYKISGPTLFGRMHDQELIALFRGYGYDPVIVDAEAEAVESRDVYVRMQHVLHDVYDQIRGRQEAVHSHLANIPRPPMIILRTPKGWTGIKELDGNKIEGNCLSHQVVAKEASTNNTHRAALEAWLHTYNFNELFDSHTGFIEEIYTLVPEPEKQMGRSRHAHGGDAVYTPLTLPAVDTYAEDAKVPGTIGSSSMRRAGSFLTEVMRLNEGAHNFRLFSPDETYSNKLDEVFEVTKRSWEQSIQPWDTDMAIDGRVIEMLSEHTLQGLLMGYILTGRHGIFASYEAFIQIVSSMADQYAKFLKIARTVSFRGDIPSLNYILTSSGWRQEHNGFSHQNPGFVDDMLNRQGCFVNAYYPPDGNSMLAVLRRSLASTREINVITAGKTLEPRWLTSELAEKELEKGLAVWDFASEDRPDIVFAAIGDYLTKEALAAISIVKMAAPQVCVRFVNIMTLNALGIGAEQCKLSHVDFNDYFTHDKPVIFNFHGYPQTIKQMLFEYTDTNMLRPIVVHGYEENGSTTTPFDMQVRNHTDRYHLAIEAFEFMVGSGVLERARADELIAVYKKKLSDHKKYILKNGVDPDEVEKWVWKRTW